MFQMLLCKVVQNVRLIFLRVASAKQQVAPRFLVVSATSIMARCNIIKAKLAPASLQGTELQEAIAIDAGVGRVPLQVRLAKSINHTRTERVGIVEHLVGNAQAKSHRTGIFHILQRTAGAASLFKDNAVAIEQLHGYAHDVVACIHQKLCGDRAINPAAHSADNAFLLVAHLEFRPMR